MEWTVVYRLCRPIELALATAVRGGRIRHGSRFARAGCCSLGEQFQGFPWWRLSDAFIRLWRLGSGRCGRAAAAGYARGPRLARRPGDRRSGGGLSRTRRKLYPFLHAALLDRLASSTFTCCRCSPTPRSLQVVGPEDCCALFALPVRTRWHNRPADALRRQHDLYPDGIDRSPRQNGCTILVRPSSCSSTGFPWELTFFLIAFLAWVRDGSSWTVVRTRFFASQWSSSACLSSIPCGPFFIRLLLNVGWYENG